MARAVTGSARTGTRMPHRPHRLNRKRSKLHAK